MEILNFKLLSPLLATSGQPSENELLQICKDGYEIVINLGLEGAEYSVQNERSILESNGVQYLHIPVKFESPEKSKFEIFSKYLKSNINKKTYIHCAANKRVSVFIALFRIIEQGWKYEIAYNEILSIWEPNEIWNNFIGEVLSSSYYG